MNVFYTILQRRSVSLSKVFAASLNRPQQSSTNCHWRNLLSTSSSFNDSSSPSLPIKDRDLSKCQPYLDYLITNDNLFKEELNDENAVAQLRFKIASILEEFEYELYKRNVIVDLDVTDKLLDSCSFQLQPCELYDIIKINDDYERRRILRFFANNKVNLIGTRSNNLLKLEKMKEMRREDNSMVEPIAFQPGLFTDDDQLIYGLWHNALFLKFRRSSMSKLFSKRMISSSLIENNSRLVIDLDYATHLNYLETRVLVTNIRLLMASHKYKSKYPCTLEFVQTVSPTANPFLQSLMSRFIHSWPDQFPYTFYQKPLPEVYPNHSLYYITPLAKQPLTGEELSDPNNIMILPGYVTQSVRDQVYSTEKLSTIYKARRLPATEHVVWNRFHGAISLSCTFAILEDVRCNLEDDWEGAFQRNLSQSLIKDSEELMQLEKKRQRNYANRIRSIEQTSHYPSYDHQSVGQHWRDDHHLKDSRNPKQQGKSPKLKIKNQNLKKTSF